MKIGSGISLFTIALFLVNVGTAFGADPTAKQFISALPSLPAHVQTADCTAITNKQLEEATKYQGAARDKAVDEKLKQKGSSSGSSSNKTADNKSAQQQAFMSMMSDPRKMQQMLQEGQGKDQDKQRIEAICKGAEDPGENTQLLGEVKAKYERRLDVEWKKELAKLGEKADDAAMKRVWTKMEPINAAAAKDYLTDATTVYENQRKQSLSCLDEKSRPKSSTVSMLDDDEDKGHEEPFAVKQWDYIKGVVQIYGRACSDAKDMLQFHSVGGRASTSH